MKTNHVTILLIYGLTFLCGIVSSQQNEIIHNSDTGSSGPQLLLLESGDNGSGSGQDGWSRLWFQNSSDLANRWGFLARPHANATDNDAVLTSPLIMAYSSVQRFGFGSDGTLRINKQYSLPNMDGNPGDVLTTDGAGNITWTSPGTTSSTVKMVFDANGINAGEYAEDFVATDSFIYLDNSVNASMYYVLPVPEGATITKVSMVAADSAAPLSAWKLRMVLLKNTTSNNGIAQTIELGAVNTTDTSPTTTPSLYDTFDINTSSVISPGEGVLVKIYSTNTAGNPTTWPGDILKLSKILLEYDMP